MLWDLFQKTFYTYETIFFSLFILFTAFCDLLANTLSLLNLVNSVNMPRMLKLNGQKFKEGEICRGRYYSCSTNKYLVFEYIGFDFLNFY